MVLVVPQSNLSQGPRLFLWSPHTLCPEDSAMSCVLQEVKFLLCHSWANGWSNPWVCSSAGAFTWEEAEDLISATGLRYFHEPRICSFLLTSLFWVSFSFMWFAVVSQRKRNCMCALYALYREENSLSFLPNGIFWLSLDFFCLNLFHWVMSSFIFPVFAVELLRWFTDVHWNWKGSMLNPEHK